MRRCYIIYKTIVQSPADYERKYPAISSRYEQVEQRLQKLMHETEQRYVRKIRLIALIHDLGEQAFVLGEWSEDAWIKMVESVTVTKVTQLIFLFKDGSKAAVSI